MPVFPSIECEPDLAKVFRRFPHTVLPLLDYHDRLLRDWSPLTVAERELIAAYVSRLNACTYCHGAHVVAARAFGMALTGASTIAAFGAAIVLMGLGR